MGGRGRNIWSTGAWAVALVVGMMPAVALAQHDDTAPVDLKAIHDDNPKPKLSDPPATPDAKPSDVTGPTRSLPTAAIPPPEYIKDDRGREYSIRFDAGNRFWVSGAWQTTLDPSGLPTPDNAMELAMGIQLRDDCTRSDMDCWKVGHEFLVASVSPGLIAPSDWPAMTARLVGGRYIRYMRRPSVTLPTRPPLTFSIPFHVGMEFAAGTAQIPSVSHVPGWELEVFQGNVLLEFWRHPTQHRALVLGVGVRYTISMKDSEDSTDVEHQLSPFTAVMAQFHFETEDGMYWVDLLGRYLPTWSNEAGWFTEAQARLRLERVILALNDLPIRLFLEADFQRHMLPFRVGGLQDDLRFLAGFSWSAQ